MKPGHSRILTDENISPRVVAFLRANGYDVSDRIFYSAGCCRKKLGDQERDENMGSVPIFPIFPP